MRADIHDGPEQHSCSKQRPDTLMQDRICRIDENLLHRTAGPYMWVRLGGSRRREPSPWFLWPIYRENPQQVISSMPKGRHGLRRRLIDALWLHRLGAYMSYMADCCCSPPPLNLGPPKQTAARRRALWAVL